MATSNSGQLEQLLQNFRMEDLKQLMEAFKKPKSGTKPVLMSRAMELINSSPPPPGLERKIKQLYKKIPIQGWFPTKQSPHYQSLMSTFWASRDALLAPSTSAASLKTGAPKEAARPKADADKKTKRTGVKESTGPKARATVKTVTKTTATVKTVTQTTATAKKTTIKKPTTV